MKNIQWYQVYYRQLKKKPEVKIDWRIVTKNPDKPLIIDVVIEGVKSRKSSEGRVQFNYSKQ